MGRNPIESWRTADDPGFLGAPTRFVYLVFLVPSDNREQSGDDRESPGGVSCPPFCLKWKRNSGCRVIRF